MLLRQAISLMSRSTLAVALLAARLPASDGPACPITGANGQGYSDERTVLPHGNEALATMGGSRITFKPGGPGCVDEQGRLWMKWPWWRKVPGQLVIEARRLDETEPPVSGFVPSTSSYGNIGFTPSALIFAHPGCWEVTGRLGDDSLSLVVLVEKVGDGPRSRCQALFPMAFRKSVP